MFKKLSILLLAASAGLVSSNAIGGTYAVDATAAGTAPAAAAPAAADPATQATAAPAAAGAAPAAGAAAAPGATTPAAATPYTPKISEAEVAAAQNAPVYTSCKSPGQFVITFDDGPNPATTPIALKYLKDKNITATFFINGINYSNLETQPEALDMIRQEYEAGHTIGSHTYRHVDLFEAIKQVTPEAIEKGSMEENVDKMTDTIEKVIGVKPAFFRPPLGKGGLPPEQPGDDVMIDKIQKYLGASGYNIIMWGCDTRDWEFRENVQAAIAELNKDLLKPGVSPATHSFITLMHDVHETTVNLVLPAVVDYVTGLGYKIVSLEECLGVSSGYQGAAGASPNNLQSNSTASANSDASAASIVEVKMIYSLVAIILAAFLFF